jgi:prephenate dehydrogenase
MSGDFLILGLNEIGASIGLALAEAGLEADRIGFDPDDIVAREAQEMGAVDRLAKRPGRAAAEADLVLLNLAADETQEYMKSIGRRLKAGTVVLNTSPNSQLAINWAAESLPEGCHYVGITLVVGPQALGRTSDHAPQPQPDLYKGGLIGIGMPPGAEEAAVNAATNLARILGASPFFLDPSEIDGMMTALDGLPSLLALALMHTTAQSPAWRDMQRLAGATFANATAPGMQVFPKALTATLIENRQRLIPRLDAVMAVLQDLRHLLTQEDQDDLVAFIEETQKARGAWIAARHRDDWEREEITGVQAAKRGSLDQMLGFDIGRPRE